MVGFEFEFSMDAKGYRTAIRERRLAFMSKFYSSAKEPLSKDDIDMMCILFDTEHIQRFIRIMFGHASYEMVNTPASDEARTYRNAVNLFINPKALSTCFEWELKNLPLRIPAGVTFQYNRSAEFHPAPMFFALHLLNGTIEVATKEYIEQAETDYPHIDFDILRALDVALVKCLNDALYDFPHVLSKFYRHSRELTASLRLMPFDDRRNIQKPSECKESYEFLMKQLEWFLSTLGLNMKGSSAEKNGTARSYTTEPGFYIESDIEEELISDPVPLPEAIAILRQVSSIISRYFSTSMANGLHVNVSVPGVPGVQYDPLKVWLASSELETLQQFNRDDNHFCESLAPAMYGLIHNRIVRRSNVTYDVLKDSLNDPKSKILSDMRHTFNSSGNCSKCFSINFVHTTMDNPYVEYRMIGNSGYESRIEELVDCTKLFANATIVGCNPTLEVKWYLDEIVGMIRTVGKIDLHQRVDDSSSIMKTLRSWGQGMKDYFTGLTFS